MTIQVEFWHLVALALTLGGIYGVIAWRLMDLTVKRLDERLDVTGKRLDEQFVANTRATDTKFDQVKQLIERLAKQGEKYGDDVLRLERELSSLRLEMMRDFTRREDHNQAIASIRIGLDNMSLRIEKALANGGRSE
jgi:hypothetical protein